MKTLAPVLAGITAIFAFGAAQSTAESQRENYNDQRRYFEGHIMRLDEQLKQQREQHQLQVEELDIRVQEVHGDLRFRAVRHDDWRVVLEKLDGRSFPVEDFVVEASLQRSPSEPPVRLETPPLDIAPWYGQDPTPPHRHRVTIPNLLESVCAGRTQVCREAEIQRIYIRFVYNDQAYRVRVFEPDAP